MYENQGMLVGRKQVLEILGRPDEDDIDETLRGVDGRKPFVITSNSAAINEKIKTLRKQTHLRPEELVLNGGNIALDPSILSSDPE